VLGAPRTRPVPHLERHHGDLEAEARCYQRHRRSSAGELLSPRLRDSASRGSTDHTAAHAVQKDRDESAPSSRYLSAASLDFCPAGIRPASTGLCCQLQRQVDRDQLSGARHQHHTGGGEQQQSEELASKPGFLSRKSTAERVTSALPARTPFERRRRNRPLSASVEGSAVSPIRLAEATAAAAIPARVI